MLPYSKVQRGTIIATASTSQDIQISSMNPPQYFQMKNIGEWGGTPLTTTPAAADIEFWWEQSMPQFTAKGLHQAVSTGAVNAFSLLTDGISTYSTASPPTFTSNSSVTAVTKGSANGVTVVTLTNDGNVARGPVIGVGDFVRLTNVVGMQQISGMLFQVVATTSTTSITIDLDSSAFAASGTTAVAQKVIPGRFYPRNAFITAISLANPCVVNLTRDTSFTIGEEVSFRIPPNNASLGFSTMQQIANVKGVVSAIKNATATSCSQVTVNINTSGFSAFSLPTSAEAAAGTAGQQPVSMIIPAGSGVVPNQNPPGTNLLDAFDNQNIYVIHLGATVFANSVTGDVWQYQAIFADEYNNQ
jgi:hypothetical protein